MLIGERIIYIELHKTGCTYTRNVLTNLPSTPFISNGKHNTIESVPQDLIGDIENKIIVGNIRNPWDWYVSLWAFGCLQKGGLYKRMTQKPSLFSKKGLKQNLRNPSSIFHNTKVWHEVYADANNPELFQKWLHILLEKKSPQGRLHEHLGVLTQRYLKLYTYNFRNELLKLSDYNDLKNFADTSFIQVFIKNEHIEEDLLKHADQLHLNKEELQSTFTKLDSRINTSERNSYESYYNDYSIDLIQKKEKLIIETFNYSF